MKVYKRGIVSFIWSMIIAVFGSAALFFVVSMFTRNSYILFSIPGVVLLMSVYMAVFSENIRFEIQEEEFKYIKRGKVRNTFDLRNCYSGYKVRTSDGSADNIQLYLVEKNTNQAEEISIDCTALGVNKFYKMYEDIKKFTEEKPEKLEVKKKLEVKEK